MMFISVDASLELRGEIKAEHIRTQYGQEFRALEISVVCTGPPFYMGNGSLGSSHTASIKSLGNQAKYRNCNLVQEGVFPTHRCHGY